MLWQILFSLFFVALVSGHGSLWTPAARSTMWRQGFKNPRNYNDVELFCGGIQRLWQRNGGKCGICGDAWDLPEPRPNEDGGTYGNGVIAKTYKAGETITIQINMAANHLGWMEFKLCPEESGVTATQECLDKHPLSLADGSGTKYKVTGVEKGIFDTKWKLPEGFKCERCVLQWHYHCGNNWGPCEDGKGRIGCGPQEYFRGCADVKIE